MEVAERTPRDTFAGTYVKPMRYIYSKSELDWRWDFGRWVVAIVDVKSVKCTYFQEVTDTAGSSAFTVISVILHHATRRQADGLLR